MTFDEFVRKHGRDLIQLAYLLSGDAHLAEDLAQSALTTTYRKWKRVSAVDDPYAYVRKILVNTHISWTRKKSSSESPTILDDYSIPVGPDFADALAQRGEMRARLSLLSPRARTIIVLRYYADVSDPNIGDLLNIAPSSVRATASRALRSLREPGIAAQFQEKG